MSIETMPVASAMQKWKPYRTYEDSGVEWLGDVPASWQIRKIKNLARPGYKTFTDGDWIESPYITDSGVRLIQTGNIGVGQYREQGHRYISHDTFYKLKCTEVMPGDVLICRLADPVGRACLAPDLGSQMITSVDVCILKTAKDFDPRFVVYFLSCDRYLDWLQSLSRGGTRDRISRSMLGNTEVIVPPLSEQRAIAAFLDRETARIDALIAKKECLTKLLAEKRKALIGTAVTRGLDPHVPMQDSAIPWLGKIPVHWQAVRAKWLFRERDSRSTSGTEELLTVSHLTGVTSRSEKNVNMFMANSLEGYKFCRPGDLVVNTLWAWMGAMGIAMQEGIVSPAYNVYTPVADIDPTYLDFLVRIPIFAQEVTRYSKGVWSSRLRLYPDGLYAVYLPLPPLDEQQRICAYLKTEVARLDKLARAAEDSIQLLHEYRTALISAAVTGKIDVREDAA